MRKRRGHMEIKGEGGGGCLQKKEKKKGKSV